MATTTDSEGAVDALRVRLDGDPGNVGLRMELADALHANRRFDDAIEQIRKVIESAPDNPEAWIALGRSQNNLQDLAGAEDSFRHATELAPANATAWNFLGHVYRALGKPEPAREAFEKALQLAPDFAPAHHNLATVYNELGDKDQAVVHFRKGLALRPDDPVGLVNLGDLLHVDGNLADAEDCYRRALELAPDYPDALAALATLLQGRNDHDEARRLFAKALEAQPAHAVALAGLAWHLELHGEPAQALALLESDPRPEPTPELLSVYARLLRRADREDEAIAMLAHWYREALEGRPVPIHLLFSLGDLYDKQGDYARAFECYRLGNERRRTRFDPGAHREQIAAQRRFFSRETIDRLPVAEQTGINPVFIVGMPRSGTSLVEQILAAHPAVKACGERDWVYRLVRSLGREPAGYPDSLAGMTSDRLNELASEYMENAAAEDHAVRWASDKLPANFQHLGLISRLFPGARVIHCRRDLMDTGLSCFRQNFKSSAMSFSHDLRGIAVYINAYQELMDHWAKVLDLPMLDLPYEALVEDQETCSRRLIAFLDLPWDDRCLRFFELDRVINTASYYQAREPVYRTSIGKWRRYEQQLAPLRELLD